MSHLHVKDTTISTTEGHNCAADATNSTLLNGIAVGTDVDERTGRTIVLRNLMCRWNLFYEPSLTVIPYIFTVAIVRDSQPQSSAPNWTDVFAVADPNSFLNVNNSGRFRVVYRKTGEIGPDQPATSYSRAPHGEYIKTLNDKVRYDGTGATVSDLSTNAYWLMYIIKFLDEANHVTNEVQMDAQVRIRYQDM